LLPKCRNDIDRIDLNDVSPLAKVNYEGMRKVFQNPKLLVLKENLEGSTEKMKDEIVIADEGYISKEPAK